MKRTQFADLGQNRRETTNFRVLVTPEERSNIMARARTCGLSVSAYLRNIGLGYFPRSVIDLKKVGNLMSVNADQKRLGNLLKLWLVDRDKYNDTQMMSVARLLEKINEVQARLSEATDEVINVARLENA